MLISVKNNWKTIYLPNLTIKRVIYSILFTGIILTFNSENLYHKMSKAQIIRMKYAKFK
jgi:hypothetical protein